jgi:hypothetical protein
MPEGIQFSSCMLVAREHHVRFHYCNNSEQDEKNYNEDKDTCRMFFGGSGRQNYDNKENRE